MASGGRTRAVEDLSSFYSSTIKVRLGYNCKSPGWLAVGYLSPDFWGLLNPEWTMCTKGRRQSPVDLDPDQILFDPFLRPLNVSNHRVRRLLFK
ncbi:alpha-carbonic anhydrase domain-containing protein [Caerostris darwini]|uniref:Alpha-carbonic anhydrase domain-containing protein n=1 Tax=Caerostris darwini TaxID=1538125 RepID=A0AAV4TLR3_9ARAC|nr:alpha-carbonic anhydrase domain-containing protein [Caerostris darwini]